MDEIRFRCPNCTGSIAVPRELAGQEVYCRYCYRKLTVPARSQPDRRAQTEELYAIDESPQDARERSQKFYLPEYRCPICGAAIPVAFNEIGIRKFCPDCGTPFSVTAEWYEQKRRQRRQEQMRSWTDPAIRLHPERYPEKNATQEVYGVSPPAASKASELVHWPEPKEDAVTAVCPVCRSILYIEKSQVGSKVRCPDCASPFKVTQKWYDSRRKIQKAKKRNAQEPVSPPAAPTSSSLPRAAAPPPAARESAGSSPAARPLIPFNCARCGGLIYLGRPRIGKKVRCPDCGAVFLLTEKKYEEIERRAEARHARLQYGGTPSKRTPPPQPSGVLFTGNKSSSPPAPKKPKAPRIPEKKLIPVLCGLCGTLMYAEKSQIGTKIRCPDCETYTTVTPPLDSFETPEPSLGDGYNISDTSDAPTVIEPTFTGGYDLAEPYDAREEENSDGGKKPEDRPEA